VGEEGNSKPQEGKERGRGGIACVVEKRRGTGREGSLNNKRSSVSRLRSEETYLI